MGILDISFETLGLSKNFQNFLKMATMKKFKNFFKYTLLDSFQYKIADTYILPISYIIEKMQIITDNHSPLPSKIHEGKVMLNQDESNILSSYTTTF